MIISEPYIYFPLSLSNVHELGKLAKDCDDNFHNFLHIHRQGFNFFQMASFLAVGLMGTKVLLIVLRL